jgi:poly(A)-specific ribonuclease
MDVDQVHFPKRLLGILGNIANATFVTFDLEMSGITTRPKYSSRDRSHDVSKPSLQQQYEEMKSAAESFQILQMGLTCVEEDREKGERFPLASPFGCGILVLFIWMKSIKRVFLESSLLSSRTLCGRPETIFL